MKALIVGLSLLSASAAFAQEDAAHRADRLRVQQLNREAATRYEQRDRRYRHANDPALADYAAARARYERDMALWRQRVAACRAGDYSACDHR